MLDEELRRRAEHLGLAGLGVTTMDPFRQARTEIEARTSDGRRGRLGFTFADPATSTEPKRSFPWAERIVSAAYSYLPEAGTPGDTRAGSARVARFAVEDFYEPLRNRLGGLADVLRRSGYRAEVLIDDNRLVDRAAAIRAGVAWSGRSTMALIPGAGPWTLLGSIVTDAPLDPTAPMRRGCGTCDVCIPACPTGALDGHGGLDARRCLAAILQAPGIVPAELREAVGDRWYGCDDCLTVCPPGRRLLQTGRTQRGRFDVAELLGMSDREMLRRFDHFYIPRRNPRYLRRNALVVAGNTAGGELLGVVAGFLGHRDWLLRLHAAWALGRIGGPRALAALSARSGTDGHDDVEAEIEAALRYAAGR